MKRTKVIQKNFHIEPDEKGERIIEDIISVVNKIKKRRKNGKATILTPEEENEILELLNRYENHDLATLGS